MSVSVASYLKGIPPGNKNPEKPAILTNFIEGVKAVGDKGVVVNTYNVVDTDVAVIQGFVHPGSKNLPHLRLRKNVLENQYKNNKRTIIVDSNLFLYADPGNTKTYLRYSYDGIFPSTGEYCNDNPNPARWNKLSKDLGIQLKPWQRFNGDAILLCCQRDGGWSMQGKRVVDWIETTVKEIKKYSDRNILVRFHPGDKQVQYHIRNLMVKKIKGLYFSKNKSLLEDLRSAYCTINYNSSPSVASAIQGVPIIVTDPDTSMSSDVANKKIADIENLQIFDREPWLHKLAQCHWTLDELKTGETWKHMKQWHTKLQ